MIISISGRKLSGKTTLAKMLEDVGYCRISVATPLKNICCQLFDWDESKLSLTEYKEEILNPSIFWNKSLAIKLGKISNIDGELLNYETKELKTRRDCLQFIGTDVLRKYDNNFHIKKLLETIKTDKKYVIDDCRFKNEIETLNNFESINIFVIRPKLREYSNHQSEIDLHWSDFSYLINNDSTLDILKRRFKLFVSQLNKTRKPFAKTPSRIDLLNYINNISYKIEDISRYFNLSYDTISKLIYKYLIPNYNYGLRSKINHLCFSKPNIENSYWAGWMSADGCISDTSGRFSANLASNDLEYIEKFKKFLDTDKLIYKNINKRKNPNYILSFTSDYIMEDFKMWNLEPRKSRFNKIPDIIRNNDKLLKPWIIGLIDGDGSIYETGCKNICAPRINILASKEVCDFIKNWCPIECSTIQSSISENLYYIVFTGQRAVKLYNFLTENCKNLGMNRKWDIIKKYIDKKFKSHNLSKTDIKDIHESYMKPSKELAKKYDITASMVTKIWNYDKEKVYGK